MEVDKQKSFNSSTMDENPTATTTADTSALLISEPTSEVNEKPLATSVSIPYPDVDDKVMNPDKDQPQQNEPIPEDLNEIKASEFSSPVGQIDPDDDSSPKIISAVLETLLTQIECNLDPTFATLAVIEDGQMELDDDAEDDEMDDEEEVETDTTTNTNRSTKSSKAEDERTAATTSGKPSIPSRRDLKPTTRTLRSHARGKMTSSASNQTSSSNPNNHGRRVSNRRRVLESRSAMMNPDKERKRRTISERSRKEKDNASTTNEDIQTSSNSDDQMTDNPNMEKVSQSTGNPNDDASSCSSTGAGEGSSTSSSTIATKQTSTDLDSFPPNKRRVRERNAGAAISNTSAPPNTATDTSATSNSNSVTEHSPADSLPTREMPINGIKQFLEIRQQIDKRHETMLNEFVLPKVPKDFAETTMAKKNYLIAPSFTSYSINTPASMGIRRCHPPHELDGHLCDVFAKQEDERYKMKLRHQVERDKLILSHEQEVLRLYGNATRSSMNQEIPFSYCSLLKDNEVYNNPAVQLPDKDRHAAMINADGSATELGKRGKHRWNGRSFIKWLEDSNLKYKRLSCEINERQRLEADTLYSMQRMVWSKHLPKESLNLSSSGRTNHLLNERYLPKVEINPNFWTHWETSPF